MANRLLEAFDRDYWQPDADTLAALQDGADALEDRWRGPRMTPNAPAAGPANVAAR
jgi:cobalamin biosynthesis Mg chelatase CobN